MKISHKVDYGVRAMVSLAAGQAEAPDQPISRDTLAAKHGIPAASLEDILRDLAKAGLAKSRRGPIGGWLLDRPADQVTVADVIRALDGPLASIRGGRPEEASYEGAAEGLQTIWIALRSGIRGVLEHVTLADVVNGTVTEHVQELAREPDAWTRR